jgi:hypothetical protein
MRIERPLCAANPCRSDQCVGTAITRRNSTAWEEITPCSEGQSGFDPNFLGALR